MKKKLISLVLAMVMVIACFAGCSKKSQQQAAEDINEAASKSAKTLVMYLMAEQDISADKAADIQAAVNKITKSKFKTQLELRFCSEDEYYDSLEAAFEQRDTAQANGVVSNMETEETGEDETFENDWGFVEIAYPKVADYQVDIFYIGDTEGVSGYDKYIEYKNAGRLQKLDDEFGNSSSKLLKSYITPSILSGMKDVNGGTYALPNNFVIGEYTYLLVNKKALADLSYNTDKGMADFTDLTCEAVQKFLREVKYNLDDESKGYTHALYSNLSQEEIAAHNVYFWGADENGELSDGFSVLASDISSDALYGQKSSYLGITDVFATKFLSQLYTVKDYKVAYDYDSEDAAKAFAERKAAVACITGGAEIPELYADDYEAIVIGNPTLEAEDLYRNMFAVSANTSSLSRSMEILTYLNTNEDFRNLIQYGICDSETDLLNDKGEEIKGRDYRFVEYTDSETGKTYSVVEKIANDDGTYDYVMDVNRTGNVFIAYPSVDDDPSLKGLFQKQNNDAKIKITLGFGTEYNGKKVDPKALEDLRELSAEVLERLMACNTRSECEELVGEIRAELQEKHFDLMDSLRNTRRPDGTQTYYSLAYVYMQWGVGKGICTEAFEE